MWPTYPTLADMEGVRRYSANTFHCWVNCGRRFGSHARTWPEGWSSGRSSANPVASVPAPVVTSYWHGRFEEVRRVERQPQVGAGAFHVLRDAVAATEDPPVAGTVREPEPRLEALLVRLVERPALAVAVLREDLLAVRQVEVGLTVVLLDDRLGVRPPHAEVERQRRRDLEVVLHEQRDAVVQVRPGLGLAAAALARRPDRAGNRRTAKPENAPP